MGSSVLHSAIVLGEKKKLYDSIHNSSANINSVDQQGRNCLFLAVAFDHPDILESLIKAGGKIDLVDFSGRNLLHYAVERNNIQCLKILLRCALTGGAKGNSLIVADKDGVTPIHLAAKYVTCKLLQLLLKSFPNSNVDVCDSNMRTPLHWASVHGSQENTKYLLKYGANVKKCDIYGKSALHYSAVTLKGNCCLQAIILECPSCLSLKDQGGRTPLHVAVLSGNLACVEALLAMSKSEVNVRDKSGRTPLHYACGAGLHTISQVLLQVAADVNATDNDLRTPFDYAVVKNCGSVLEVLLKFCGKQISKKELITAIHRAAASGSNTCLVRCLSYYPDGDLTDSFDRTPLHFASACGNLDTVSILLMLGSSPSPSDSEGRTPLLYAAKGGHSELLKKLLKGGASIEERDNTGLNSLHYSVIEGHLFLAQVIMKAGVFVDTTNNFGQTPLHIAASLGLNDMLCLLLENRANINARDNCNRSVLHFAVKSCHIETVKLLLEYNAFPNFWDDSEESSTPLDLALEKDCHEIAQLLISSRAVTFAWIRQGAAYAIQTCWRNYKRKCETSLDNLQETGCVGNSNELDFKISPSKDRLISHKGVTVRPLLGEEMERAVQDWKNICSEIVVNRVDCRRERPQGKEVKAEEMDGAPYN